MKISKIPNYLYDLLSGTRKIKISFEYVNSFKKDSIDSFFNYNFDNISYKNNEKTYKQLVAIDGIAGSAGSSAIVDFLEEFSCCTSIGGVDVRQNPQRGIENCFEVDLFRDSHGIYDLERIVYTDVDRIISGAITDFIKLTLNNYKSGNFIYDDNYMYLTKKFLDNIIDFYVIDSNGDYSFFIKKISKEQYRKLAKDYLLDFLKNMQSSEYLIMDNLCSITSPDNSILEDYFGDYKLVASYRDPRDVYTTGRLLTGNDWIPKDPKLFVKWYRSYYNNFMNVSNPNLLLIRFEDFIYDYDNISQKILKFLGLDESMHDKKFAYFNPNISCKNVGLYKTYKDQSAIKILEDELSDLLWK